MPTNSAITDSRHEPATAPGSEPFLPALSSAEIPVMPGLVDERTIHSIVLTSGLLGGATVAEMVRRSVALLPGHSAQLVLPHELSLAERAVRRVTCANAGAIIGLGKSNIDLRRFRCEQHSGWVARKALAEAERNRAADILHIIRQPQAFGLLKRMERTPSLVYVDCSQRLARAELPSSRWDWTYGPSIWWDGRVFSRAAWIVAESDWVRRDIESQYPNCADKCITLTTPVWLDTFSSDLAAVRRRRQRERLKVLFVGGDFVRKGGPLLLEAWRSGRFHEFAELNIVTNETLTGGPLPAGVQQHRGVKAYSPAWIEFFTEADVFVLPTRHEAMGQVFKEAAAAGLPCVATNINAIPEIIHDGITGRLVPVDDVAALRQALGDLLKSPQLRYEYGTAARRLVEDRCHPAKYSERLGELMTAALAGTITGAVRRPRRPGAPVRVLCMNSGFLGHKSVARLIDEVLSTDLRIDDTHLDLEANLTLGDRAIRRVMCARVLGRTGFHSSNLDFARYRGEMHSGLLAARRLKEWERRHGEADVLHFHTQATAYCSLRRMARTPSIISIDCTQRLASLEAPSALERKTFWPNLVRDGAVFRRAFAITCTSEWAAADLRDCYPDAAAKVHVMPYPVRLDLFDPDWASRRAARWQADANRKVQVLFIGGDFPRKGGEELLAAWTTAQLADRAELVLVSGWSFANRTLPPGVSVVSGISAYTPAWRELWESADLFVMPTRGEAFGMVYQEAAAAGLPAIGTRLNAVPEIIAEGETGLLVTPGKVDELSHAMTRLVDDAELRHRFGQAARNRAERLYDPRTYAGRLADLLLAAHASRSAR